jgi:tetratricopeptide (TPR) repeat protein
LIKRFLAGAYLDAGDAKTSLQLYKEVGLADASPKDYQGAIGAAFAAGDRQDAKKWLRQLLEKEPTDPSALRLAAKFEQASGNRKLAARYYRAALENTPKEQRALTIPATLHDSKAPAVPVPPSLLTTLASVTDASGAPSGLNNASTRTERSYGAAYLPGEQATPVMVPLFVPQRNVTVQNPPLPLATANSQTPSWASARTRLTLRNRPPADSGNGDMAPTSQALYQNQGHGAGRLGDYDPAR